MVQALVQDRQASCPSTRTGSTGALPHMGHSSRIDDAQLPGTGWPTWTAAVPPRAVLVQDSTDERTFWAGRLDSVEA
jgi:hypothetical protein